MEKVKCKDCKYCMTDVCAIGFFEIDDTESEEKCDSFEPVK